jgi:multisubunit Na+/H+ antiporter MnhG subunit
MSNLLVTTVSEGLVPPAEPITWLALLDRQLGDRDRFRRFFLTLLLAVIFVLGALVTAPVYALSMACAAAWSRVRANRVGVNSDDTA